MRALVRIESSGNPYAIGVVAGHLVRQPLSAAEAVATARWLQSAGHNFSMGLIQVNHRQAVRYGQTLESMFEPCRNLKVGAAILGECHARALALLYQATAALRAALSCYYSGNFSGGLRQEGGRPSYVDRVLADVEATTPSVASAAPDTMAPIGLIDDPDRAAMPRRRESTARPTAAAAAGQWVWLLDGHEQPLAATATKSPAAARHADFVQMMPEENENGGPRQDDVDLQHGSEDR